MPHKPPQIDRACGTTVSSFTERGVNEAVRQLAASSGQHPAQAIVTVGGQVGSERAVNVALVDALRRPLVGSHLILVWVAATEGGAPGGTQTVQVIKGTLIREVEVGRLVLVETDVDAKATVEIGGTAGTRWAGVAVVGPVWGGLVALS